MGIHSKVDTIVILIGYVWQALICQRLTIRGHTKWNSLDPHPAYQNPRFLNAKNRFSLDILMLHARVNKWSLCPRLNVAYQHKCNFPINSYAQPRNTRAYHDQLSLAWAPLRNAFGHSYSGPWKNRFWLDFICVPTQKNCLELTAFYHDRPGTGKIEWNISRLMDTNDYFSHRAEKNDCAPGGWTNRWAT